MADVPEIRKGQKLTADALSQAARGVNEMMRRFGGQDEPTSPKGPRGSMRYGWLGIIRETGPNDEDDYEITDPRYWVERVDADSTNNDDATKKLSLAAITDLYDDLQTPHDYVTATNIAECTYTDGGGEVTMTSPRLLAPGQFVRVMTVGVDGDAFHFFDAAGPGPELVQLDNVSDGVYDVYHWDDDPAASDTVAFATSKVPIDRAFGTSIDFVQYGETGMGYWGSDGVFVLVKAFEERYDVVPCTPP